MDFNHFREAAAHVHSINVEAGWWTDLETGESLLWNRNRAEVLMLIVSELVEAKLAFDKPDDHLPQYPGYLVELADARIRAMDEIGSFFARFDTAPGAIDPAEIMSESRLIVSTAVSADGIDVVIPLGLAMESLRKFSVPGMRNKYLAALIAFVSVVDGSAQHYLSVPYAPCYPGDEFLQEKFAEIIAAKIEYNKKRADHKIENRKKDDGKKC